MPSRHCRCHYRGIVQQVRAARSARASGRRPVNAHIYFAGARTVAHDIGAHGIGAHGIGAHGIGACGIGACGIAACAGASRA
jgi:hypothetical protein